MLKRGRSPEQEKKDLKVSQQNESEPITDRETVQRNDKDSRETRNVMGSASLGLNRGGMSRDEVENPDDEDSYDGPFEALGLDHDWHTKNIHIKSPRNIKSMASVWETQEQKRNRYLNYVPPPKRMYAVARSVNVKEHVNLGDEIETKNLQASKQSVTTAGTAKIKLSSRSISNPGASFTGRSEKGEAELQRLSQPQPADYEDLAWAVMEADDFDEHDGHPRDSEHKEAAITTFESADTETQTNLRASRSAAGKRWHISIAERYRSCRNS